LGKYICAFRGRRDYYQVPIALSEAGMLEQFITDAYAGKTFRSIARMLPKGLRQKVRSRYEPSLPELPVRSLWSSTAIEYLRHRLGCAPSVTFAKLDRQFGLAVADRARKGNSNLLIYSHYAWEAFTQRYQHIPKKVLFQFHPHPDSEHHILLRDSAKYPFVGRSFEEEAGQHVSDDLKKRTRDSWKYADLILCASSFTRRSLLEVGADPGRCKVIPYGIDLPHVNVRSVPLDRFTALFVGTGTQRKGLHHLLLAWQRAHLPADSRLTLVCRSIDSAIASLAERTRNVHLIRGLAGDDLKRLFKDSSVLVMPSLVEGFGQVYLEALAYGCPVLGTPNTGLPDLCDGNDPIWQVEPGQIDELVSTLEFLSRKLPGDSSVRRRAQACAARWPWGRFRAGILSALQFA
jgi:glycosyltransferase involved in cell wall biosynthesis